MKDLTLHVARLREPEAEPDLEVPQPPPLRFYPAYCFALSPTYNTWVRLTAADIHSLTPASEIPLSLLSAPHGSQHQQGLRGCHDVAGRAGVFGGASGGFAGQPLFFYLNHPIRWVRIVGVVVSIDDYERVWIVGVDDGSGAVVEGVWVKRKGPVVASSGAQDDRGGLRTGGHGVNGKRDAPSAKAQQQQQQQGEDLGSLFAKLDIGSVVKMKGGIGQFRGVRQVEVKRMSMSRMISIIISS